MTINQNPQEKTEIESYLYDRQRKAYTKPSSSLRRFWICVPAYVPIHRLRCVYTVTLLG